MEISKFELVTSMTSSPSQDKLKQELLALGTTRTEMENQIKDIQAVLKSMGLSKGEKLVDSEGFPRTDVDIVDP